MASEAQVRDALHAHVFPRYDDEPEALRTKPIWSYDWDAAPAFDERAHAPLLEDLRSALRAERLQNRLDIQGQIRYNEARARFQEDEKIREGIFARQMESDYQAQIKKVFETSEPKTYYPRSHTKWFT